MIKSNTMASTVSHTENCLYDIKSRIEAEGSVEQQELLLRAFDALEELYYTLQEES